MKKEKSSVISRSYIDTQHLKDAFFTPSKKKPKPKNKKLLFLPILFVLLVLLLFFIFKYDFILIPRSGPGPASKDSSLFSQGLISSVNFIGQDKNLMRVKKSLVYLTVPQNKKVGVKFDLTKPINLNTNQLLLLIKKSNIPYEMEVVLRDNRFFSNARAPIKIIMDKNDNSSYNKIPIQFQSFTWPNVNFARINQIKIYFYQPKTDNESSSLATPLKTDETNWILINDIDLKSKEDK